MARVIPSEFTAIMKASVGEVADILRVTGTIPTPAGPRVQFEIVGSPDPAATNLTAEYVAEVAEAASRYLAVRWRYDGEPRPVPPKHWEILSKLHPTIFNVPTDTGEGWHWLLCMIAEWLSEGGLPPRYETTQVKEKFGGLRFYHQGTPSTLKIARAVEQVSYGVCEACGAPGRLRKGGWARTLCDDHASPKQR